MLWTSLRSTSMWGVLKKFKVEIGERFVCPCKSSHHFFSDHISNNLLFLILCISLVSPYLSRVQCWYVICIKKFLYPIWCKYCYINECVNQKLKKLFQTGQAGAKECPNRDNPHADSSNAQDCRVQWWTYFRIEVVTHQSHSYIYIYIQDVQLYLPDFNFYFESSIVLFCDEVFVVVQVWLSFLLVTFTWLSSFPKKVKDVDGNIIGEEQISVEEHYHKVYALRLKYPHLPALDVGRKKKPTYIPLEVHPKLPSVKW